MCQIQTADTMPNKYTAISAFNIENSIFLNVETKSKGEYFNYDLYKRTVLLVDKRKSIMPEVPSFHRGH